MSKTARKNGTSRRVGRVRGGQQKSGPLGPLRGGGGASAPVARYEYVN